MPAQPQCTLVITLTDNSTVSVVKPRLKDMEAVLEQLASQGFLLLATTTPGQYKSVMMKDLKSAVVTVNAPEVV